jgi:hypothetical protein
MNAFNQNTMVLLIIFTDDETTPDSLTHKDIGVPIGRGSMKTAYILKDHPDLLFLQLDERLERCSKTLPIFLELCVVQVDFSSS